MKQKKKLQAKDLKKLPRWGRVAVIARAMRRVMPMIAEMLGKNSTDALESIEFAVSQSEASTADGKFTMLRDVPGKTHSSRSVPR